MDCTDVSAADSKKTRRRYPCSKNVCLLSLTKKGGDFLSKLKLVPRQMATNHSVRVLIQRMVSCLREEVGCKPASTSSREPYQVLECPSCEGFMNKAICLPCGHSMCKPCSEKPTERAKDTIMCYHCKRSSPKTPIGFQNCRSPTVLIQNLSESRYPALIKSCWLREQGNKMANEKKLPEAVDQYTEALRIGTF